MHGEMAWDARVLHVTGSSRNDIYEKTIVSHGAPGRSAYSRGVFSVVNRCNQQVSGDRTDNVSILVVYRSMPPVSSTTGFAGYNTPKM